MSTEHFLEPIDVAGKCRYCGRDGVSRAGYKFMARQGSIPAADGKSYTVAYVPAVYRYRVCKIHAAKFAARFGLR